MPNYILKKVSDWLPYLAVFVAGLTLWFYPAFDPDLGWQLFGGSYLLSHGLPQFDPINSFNPFWFNYHWLAQILMYKAYEFGGYNFLRCCLGIVVGLQLVVVYSCTKVATGGRVGNLYSLLISLFFLLFVSHVTSLRPQALSVLIVLIALREILKGGRFEIPFLFLLTVLLVNIHIYWVLVPFLWFIFRIVPHFSTVPDYSRRYAFGGLAILLLAPFVSPYGAFAPWLVPTIPFDIWGNYVLLVEYILSPSQFSEMIDEFKGTLSAFNSNFYCLIGLFTFFIVLESRRSLKEAITAKMLCAVGILAACKSIKFINLSAIFAVPYLANRFSALPERPREANLLTALTLVTAVAFCVYANPWNSEDRSLVKDLVPINLCSKLDTYGVTPSQNRDHVRVLTHFNHGGWCRWSLYQKNPAADYRVITDGRTQFIEPSFFMNGFDLYRARAGWRDILTDWAPDMIVTEINWPLAQVLYYSQGTLGWKLADKDNNFAVFVRSAEVSPPPQK